MTTPQVDPEDGPDPPTPAQAAQSRPAPAPRLRVPQRDQVPMNWATLEQMLEPDHPVRIVWEAVSKLQSIFRGEIEDRLFRFLKISQVALERLRV